MVRPCGDFLETQSFVVALKSLALAGSLRAIGSLRIPRASRDLIGRRWHWLSFLRANGCDAIGLGSVRVYWQAGVAGGADVAVVGAAATAEHAEIGQERE